MNAGISPTPRAAYNPEYAFKREKLLMVIGTLGASTLVIFLLETFLMFFLEDQLMLSRPAVYFLDGLILVACLLPLNYVFIVQPMLRHIEAHHHSELQLIKSNKIFERFLSLEDLAIAYMDARFNLFQVNGAFARLGGREPADYAGRNYFDLFAEEHNRAMFEAVVSSGRQQSTLEMAFRKPGSPEEDTTYWDWNLLPIKDDGGAVIELLLFMNDVTYRKMAEDARQESELRFSGVFNQSFQHTVLLDPGGTIQVANQTSLDFTGLAAGAVVGKPLWEAGWWHEENGQGQAIHAAVTQAAEGKVGRVEGRVLSAAGDKSEMDITIKPLVDRQGRTSMLIYQASDITERIRSEESLRHSEEEINRLYTAEKQARRLSDTLQKAVAELSTTLDSLTVLGIYLDQLRNGIPYRLAYLLLTEDEDHLRVRLARGEEGFPAPNRLEGRRFDISDLPFLQPVLKNRQMLIFGSVPPDLVGRREAVDQESRCFLGIPLHAGENVIGVCLVERPPETFFTTEIKHWASVLTSEAVIAMQNAWLFEQVRDNHERLQALSRRLVEVQELERQHIARELHDEAGQSLASLMVGLRLLERDGTDQAALSQRCQELRELTDGVLENLHRLAADLRPSSLDHLGLEAALRQHTKLVSDQHELTVQFETVGNIGRLPDEIETAIYRIVQEALTNIIRHAHASRADVLLERRQNSVLVIVEDNGVGFNVQAPHENQFGLVGMQERAEMLGGAFTLESEKDRGTTIIVEFKCPSNY